MSEDVVVARPYAKAVFDFACKQNKLAFWGELLETLTVIVTHHKMAALIRNPRISDTKASEIIIELCKKIGYMDDHGSNFLKLLAKNHRLSNLPTIEKLFKQLRASHEKRIEVEIRLSYPLTEKQKHNLSQALEKKFDRKVSMKFIDDSTLLGGMIIRVGDYVIDASIKGKLARLSNYLNLKEKLCL